MSGLITHTRDGVTVKEARAMLAKARRAFVWVRATPEDGFPIEISKAQARRIIDAVVELDPGSPVLAWTDAEGDFRIN